MPNFTPPTAPGTSSLTGLSAPGSPAYNPSWYAATDVYWDPSGANGGSDENMGTDVLHPILTWTEAVRRYGSDSPLFNDGQSLTVHKLSAQAPNVDPVFFYPRISGGGYAALIDTLVVFAGPFAAGVVTLLSKGGGTDLTVASMPAGVTAGMYVLNSTSGSYAFVKSMSGTTATMTQPIAPPSGVGLSAGAMGTNWVTGDTLTVYNVPNLTNLKAWRPSGSDISATTAGVGWVQWTQVADPSGVGNSTLEVFNDSAGQNFQGCYFAGIVSISSSGAPVGNVNVFSGCFFAQAVTPLCGPGFIFGGCILGSFNNRSIGFTLGGNVILSTSSTMSVLFITDAHNSGGLSILRGGIARVSGTLWGAGGVSVDAMAAYENGSGTTFALSLLCTGGNSFGSSLTGTKYVGGTFTDGVALTPANMDAFNGLQDPLTGARFCNPQ
jgi:hypothetical protein